MNNKWNINKVTSYLILTISLGILIAGCGGGGDTGTVSGGVASYLADQQGGGTVGRWWYAVSASSVAKADEKSIVAIGTNQYTATKTHLILSNGTSGSAGISGTWGTNSTPDVYYNLISSGWFANSDTATLLDNGDGRNVTITLTGEPAYVAAITKTSLANTPIACTSSAGIPMTCVAPGVYPAGAVYYRQTVSFTSNQFTLNGPTIAQPITDSSGIAAPVPTWPVLNTTFCDPAWSYVFQARGTGGIYDVFSTTSCISANITTAVGATSLGTVTMNLQSTGNLNVPSVLHIQSTTGTTLSGLVNMIYGARVGALWYGWMLPVGTYQLDPEYNKTAINAQLLGDGLVVLP